MVDHLDTQRTEETLDPPDWHTYKALAHQMIEDIFSFMESIADQPVWEKPPDSTKKFLMSPLPRTGEPVASIYRDFKEKIWPYRKGNIHPRFFSWVEGNGTITGAMADFLAAVMNSNLAIGDHSAVYVEHQVINWCKEIVGYPPDSSGLIVSGGSVANVTALIVARNAFQNENLKKTGLKQHPSQLVVYCSTETHNCLFKAVETIGVGSDYLRKIPVNAKYQIDLDILEAQIRKDKKNGLVPFCIIGNAGTVNTGALDPLADLASISKRERMWFHVDGAIGGVLHLLPEFELMLRGMNQADSIAFDLHKWLYINYEAGCILVRNESAHRDAFSQPASYLSKHERGLAAGPDSFSTYGLELSRSFKSLKVWMSIKEHGIEKYARLIRQNIAQAFYMQEKIQQAPALEMVTPVTLNIVCYRYNPGNLSDEKLNALNKEILMTMQERGIAAPSYTVLGNRYAIRLSITNHRTVTHDLDAVIEATVSIGKELLQTYFKN